MPMGDRIACGYHGVQVGKDGTVMSVPGAPGSKLEGRKCVKSFPTQERAGVIFAYAGDALHPEPIELQFPEQLTSPEFSSFLCYCEWGGDYRYVYDNVMDPMHGTFLHKQSHSMSFGDTHGDLPDPRHADRLRVREGRPAQRQLRLDRVPRHRRALAAARDPLSRDRRAGRQLPHRRRLHADQREARRRLPLALPQGRGLAARHLALPLQEPARGAALGACSSRTA